MDGFIVKRVSKLVAMKEVQSVMVACSGVGVPGEVSTLLIQVPFLCSQFSKGSSHWWPSDVHEKWVYCILNADTEISEYTPYTRIYSKLHQW